MTYMLLILNAQTYKELYNLYSLFYTKTENNDIVSFLQTFTYLLWLILSVKKWNISHLYLHHPHYNGVYKYLCLSKKTLFCKYM